MFLLDACHAADNSILHQILRFVKEWSRLTAMKQKIVRKSGQIFCSPIHAAEELSKKQSVASSTKRYVFFPLVYCCMKLSVFNVTFRGEMLGL